MHRCKDQCVYKRDDDVSDTPDEICFKDGGNPNDKSMDVALHLGGCIGISDKY